MEKLIELQKEFEELISELEKLKSINELSEDNTLTAKSVVQGIDKIVIQFDEFYNNISNEYIGIEKNLNKTIDGFSEQVKNLDQIEKTHFENFSKETAKVIEDFKINLEKRLYDLSNEFNIINTSIESLIASNKETIINEFNDVKKAIQSSIDESSKLTEQIVGLGLEEKIKTLSKHFDDSFTTVKVELKTHIDNNSKVINDLINDSNTKTIDSMKEESSKIKKENTDSIDKLKEHTETGINKLKTNIIDQEKKNKLSHRGKALHDLALAMHDLFGG